MMLLLPDVETVRALARFVQDRTEESAHRILRCIPAEQHDTPAVIRLVRIPRAVGMTARFAAQKLEEALLDDQVDVDVARALWRTLLTTARPFRMHRDVPADAREALEAAKAA